MTSEDKKLNGFQMTMAGVAIANAFAGTPATESVERLNQNQSLPGYEHIVSTPSEGGKTTEQYNQEQKSKSHKDQIETADAYSTLRTKEDEENRREFERGEEALRKENATFDESKNLKVEVKSESKIQNEVNSKQISSQSSNAEKQEGEKQSKIQGQVAERQNNSGQPATKEQSSAESQSNSQRR